MSTKKSETKYPVELLEKVGKKEAIRLLQTGNYILQEKLNGYRIQIRRDSDGTLTAYNRKGQIRTDRLDGVDFRSADKSFVVDGELVNGKYSAYDLLELEGQSCKEVYEKRFARLASIGVRIVPSWSIHQLDRLQQLEDSRCEGAVLKLKSAPYCEGRNGQHKKVKFWKTASVIVMEVRPHGKESVRLGLYDRPGHLVSVGRCTAIGKIRCKVGDIVEVKYLYATKERQLYQAELLELRDDIDAADCTIKKQLVVGKGLE